MQTRLFCQDTPLKACKEIDKSGVATGYVGKAEASRSAFDAEGYFCTGDIVQMAPVVTNTGLEGQPFQPEMAWAYRLTVIDRKSNMLKLAAGEFVAPQELEQFYAQSCSLASMLFVHGEMGGDFLVAVVVLEMDAAHLWAAENGQDTAELTSNTQLQHAVLRQLRDSPESAGRRPSEVPRAVLLTHEPFTIENGLLNPSGKFARRIAASRFSTELAAMHEQGGGGSAGDASEALVAADERVQVFTQERLVRRLAGLVEAEMINF